MGHQPQKRFRDIFFGIPQQQKGDLVCVPGTQKSAYSHDVVFDKTFSSALAYMPHTNSESLAIQPEVSYIPYATSSHARTGNIITFAQFEESNSVKNKLNI